MVTPLPDLQNGLPEQAGRDEARGGSLLKLLCEVSAHAGAPQPERWCVGGTDPDPKEVADRLLDRAGLLSRGHEPRLEMRELIIEADPGQQRGEIPLGGPLDVQSVMGAHAQHRERGLTQDL